MTSTKKKSSPAKKGDNTTLLLVGTKKGAFVFTSKDGRRTWKISGPHFSRAPVYHVAYDRRNKMIIASVADEQWGPAVARSFDFGETWSTTKTPPAFPKGKTEESVKRIWHFEPGAESEPDVIYAGVDPAMLFRSEDKGETWKINESLYNHETRSKWVPGFGGLCLHTILVDRKDPKNLHIGISAVGTLNSRDGGETWKFQNKNVLADLNPNKYPEYGQCVHKIARHPEHSDILYQQNHFGVYRSDDGGEDWKDIRNNLPSRFGFPMAVDANDPKKIYVVPLEEPARFAPNGQFAVWTSDNSGKDWYALKKGFPKVSYHSVLREGMVADSLDPCGIYAGTTTGQLFASRNHGNAWTTISDELPTILSVQASPV